jgi:transcriptional regulator with XRE-family HTH domain
MLVLAQDLGVDESAISRWKKNGPISLDHAARLCEVLDISLDWLILGRGDAAIHKRTPLSERQTSLLAAAQLLSPGSFENLIAFLTSLGPATTSPGHAPMRSAQD